LLAAPVIYDNDAPYVSSSPAVGYVKAQRALHDLHFLLVSFSKPWSLNDSKQFDYVGVTQLRICPESFMQKNDVLHRESTEKETVDEVDITI